MNIPFNLPEGSLWWEEAETLSLKAMKVARSYISEHIKPLTEQESDFEWLKASLMSTTFQHLCFRYKNNIYSIVPAIQDGNSLLIKPATIKSQLYYCQLYSVIPCIMPLVKDTNEPISTDSYLLDTRTGQPIKIVAGDKTVMAKWELVNMALQVVGDYIKQQGGSIRGYGILKEPQILFVDKEDVKSYAIVNTHYSWEETKISKKNVMSKFKGYFADVEILADKETKLWRNNPVPYKFEGLEPVEKKIEDGTIIDAPVKVAPSIPVAPKPTAPASLYEVRFDDKSVDIQIQ